MDFSQGYTMKLCPEKLKKPTNQPTMDLNIRALFKITLKVSRAILHIFPHTKRTHLNSL